MAIPWATNLLHFHLNRLLKNGFNLALFCLATVLATFQKIGRFFPNRLVTLDTNKYKSMGITLIFSFFYCHPGPLL
jgi:hypothetical protein